MTLRRTLILLGSTALAVILVALLVRIGKIDLLLTLRQVRSVSLAAFGKLVILNVLLVLLSTAKWRSVDALLRAPSDAVPSRATSFAVTSAGMALGLVLPVQLGMTTARTLGTYFHGRPFRRGTAGTLLEQSFDVLIVLFLGVASGIAYHYKGGAVMWIVAAAGMVVMALVAAAPAIRALQSLAHRAANSPLVQRWAGPAAASLSELELSREGMPRLARRLVVLSTVRFAVIVLMAAQTAQAVGAQIPLWHMAAAIPFVVFANLFAVTPGGVGVNELTSTTALVLFGTPMRVAAPWSLANRILATAACFAVAAGAVLMVVTERLLVSKNGSEQRGVEAEEL